MILELLKYSPTGMFQHLPPIWDKLTTDWISHAFLHEMIFCLYNLQNREYFLFLRGYWQLKMHFSTISVYLNTFFLVAIKSRGVLHAPNSATYSLRKSSPHALSMVTVCILFGRQRASTAHSCAECQHGEAAPASVVTPSTDDCAYPRRATWNPWNIEDKRFNPSSFLRPSRCQLVTEHRHYQTASSLSSQFYFHACCMGRYGIALE